MFGAVERQMFLPLRTKHSKRNYKFHLSLRTLHGARAKSSGGIILKPIAAMLPGFIVLKVKHCCNIVAEVLYICIMQVREVIQIIEKDGWYLVRQKGSHRQYKHPIKVGLVTIAVHKLSDDITSIAS